jgi:BirA family biotin operon repressor/biotin-[acetyl-CoA-carboxylase] ligase
VVKWPNDLLCGGRKLAGILVELDAEADRIRHLIVGVGINVNSGVFPPELAQRATSIILQRGERVSRPALLAAVLARLEHWIDRLLERGAAAVIEAWLGHAAAWLGRPVEVQTTTGVISGVAVGLDPNGALLLRDAAGREQRVLAGDVRLPDDR